MKIWCLNRFYNNAFFQQLSKFSFVGVITTIYGIIAYYILLEKLQLPLYPVYVVVYLIGVLISYLLNSKFTFNKVYNLNDSMRYLISYVISLGIGLLLLHFFNHLLEHISDFHLTLIVIPFRFLITFLLLKILIYR